MSLAFISLPPMVTSGKLALPLVDTSLFVTNLELVIFIVTFIFPFPIHSGKNMALKSLKGD